MKKPVKSQFFILMISSALLLTACSEAPVQKSTFGQVDAMQDGKILIDNSGEGEPENTDNDGSGEEVESATSDSTIKTAKTLDVGELPIGVSRMIGICDAVNMACVEQKKVYTSDDPEFIWHAVHLYVANCRDKAMGFKKVNEVIDADPKVVASVLYAMFGKLRNVPPVPELRDGELPHISVSNDMQYRFSVGDRGTSTSEARRVTEYSDGSMEMEVALVDAVTGEETVSFIYTLRSNTRDTTTSALFDYEITGARGADKNTTDKISGIPFFSPVVQTYGYNSYSEGDSKRNEVIEVLMYNSFQDHVPGMDELNEGIRKDILAFAQADEDEESWKEIKSYPVTTDDHIQLAVSFASCSEASYIPDIRCYIYDKKKKRALDINDALTRCSTTENELSEKVGELWAQRSENASGVSAPKGFIIRKDGTVDFFFTLDENDPETGTKTSLAVYNSKGQLKVFEKGADILPEDECDPMRPTLTHGRKED